MNPQNMNTEIKSAMRVGKIQHPIKKGTFFWYLRLNRVPSSAAEAAENEMEIKKRATKKNPISSTRKLQSLRKVEVCFSKNLKRNR